ncbi:plexin domain-containing protein 2-like [Antedon mediterranea]|uniref:plexin domain-containing protein 2-like n=1 Tax=Antedon mediterranea TaxID=105859 RepID=UPI003AF7B030
MQIFILLCLLAGATTVAASSKYSQITKEKADSFLRQVEVSDDATTTRSLRKKRQDKPDPADEPTDVGYIKEDQHMYYNSTYYSNGQDLYVDVDKDPVNRFIPHSQLSNTFLTADKIRLPFTFLFYGHEVDSVLLATGGFLYLGSFFHEYLSATQYIAPLMGSFDPSLNDSSTIKYGNNGTAFTVEWSKVHINHLEDAGSFTFQTTLMNDGRIIFAYKNIPLAPSEIGGGNGHKVTVGLSDAFYYDEPLSEGSSFYKRTIYRYDTLELNDTLVMSSSAFILTPLPTCTQQKSCSKCFSGNVDSSFDCKWCPSLNLCSSGFDRNRQDWSEGQCDTVGVKGISECPGEGSSSNTTVIVVVVILLVITIGVIGLLVIASRCPLTTAGRALSEVKSTIFKKTTPPEDKYNITKDDAVDQEHANAQAPVNIEAPATNSKVPSAMVITNHTDVSHA